MRNLFFLSIFFISIYVKADCGPDAARVLEIIEADHPLIETFVGARVSELKKKNIIRTANDQTVLKAKLRAAWCEEAGKKLSKDDWAILAKIVQNGAHKKFLALQYGFWEREAFLRLMDKLDPLPAGKK